MGSGGRPAARAEPRREALGDYDPHHSLNAPGGRAGMTPADSESGQIRNSRPRAAAIMILKWEGGRGGGGGFSVAVAAVRPPRPFPSEEPVAA